MEYFIIGATFGILFGFAVGILFNGLLRTTKTKREQAAKQREELKAGRVVLEANSKEKIATWR